MTLRKFALDATILTAARIFQAAATALSLPLLARFLKPSDFGLVAAANSILFLASVLADAGFANSLVRTSSGDKRAWSSVFWITLFWSACLALLLLVIAIPASWLLKEPDVAPLIAVMAILPLVQGLLAAPMADLQQRHRFGWIGTSDVLGSVAGIAAAVYFAVRGFGAWALVAQSLAFLMIKAGVIIGSTRFRPSLAFDMRDIDEHLHFARNTGAVAVLLFLSSQMDNIMIARSVGSGPLGLYSMAYRIMSLPAMLGSAYGALYPHLVKLSNDKGAMRQLLLSASMILAIVVFPPMALLCVTSKSFFTILFSDRWVGSAIVFSYLAPVGALQAINGIHSFVLMAVGRTDTRLRISIEFVVLWLIVLFSVAHLGIHAVAIGLLLSNLAYYPRLLVLALKPIDCPVIEYLRVMLVPLGVAAFVACTQAAIQINFSIAPLVEMCGAAFACLVAYAIIAFLMRRDLSDALVVLRTLLRQTNA